LLSYLIVSFFGHKTCKTLKTVFLGWGKRPTGPLSGGNAVACRHTLSLDFIIILQVLLVL
jgi:hypothetical protein